MSETRITEGIRLSLAKLKAVHLFANRLENQPEFKDNAHARVEITGLKESLKYSERLFKGLYQQAAAYALREDRIIPEKES